MAILDKENRPRGLRMPSLSRFQKKTQAPASPPPKDENETSAPVRPPRPQEKELPPNPLPPPPSLANPNYQDRPLPSFPRVPVPRPQEPPVLAPVQNTPPAPSQEQPQYYSYNPTREPEPEPEPEPEQEPEPVSAPTPVRAPVPFAEPPRQHDDVEDPLEDFIPEPEPELDGTNTLIEPVSSEENNGPWTPPDVEPVAAPLNKLHYACYQDHRSMPVANNVWHPLPCMTCQKFNRDVRHRCVFCCLRICADCFQTLQKCPNRSLAQLMETLPSQG